MRFTITFILLFTTAIGIYSFDNMTADDIILSIGDNNYGFYCAHHSKEHNGATSQYNIDYYSNNAGHDERYTLSVKHIDLNTEKQMLLCKTFLDTFAYNLPHWTSSEFSVINTLRDSLIDIYTLYDLDCNNNYLQLTSINKKAGIADGILNATYVKSITTDTPFPDTIYLKNTPIHINLNRAIY